MNKLTNDELRHQFDGEVERFSDENTGQATAVDALLVFQMLDETLPSLVPGVERLCDIGCGAGNFALRIARLFRGASITLVDLSRAMLDRATQRLEAERFVVEQALQGDILTTPLGNSRFDIVTAAASLHHLRCRDDFHAVYRKIAASLRPGGVFWMSDLVQHDLEAVESVQRRRYADYLTALKDRAYQENVFRLIELGDTPESVAFHVTALLQAGFHDVDVLHKNMVFATLVARKSPSPRQIGDRK